MGIFNIIWFVIFGWASALSYLLFGALMYITIIGIPIGKALFNLSKLCAFPFGKEVIREVELKGSENVGNARKTGGILLNIIWFPFGLFLSISHLILGIIAFITVIGIPVGIVMVRLAKFILFAIGAKVVSKKEAYAAAVANEIKNRNN